MSKNPDFKALLRNLESTKSLLTSQKEIVNGQFTGPGSKQTHNLQKHTKVAKDAEGAKTDKLYRDMMLGQIDRDLSEDEIQKMVTETAKTLLDGIFEGF